jgi:hypothetical protein
VQTGVDLERFRAWASTGSPASRALASILVSAIIVESWAVIVAPLRQRQLAG